MVAQDRRRRGLMWAIIGAAVLLVGVVAIIIAAITAQPAPPPTPDAPSESAGPTDPPSGDADPVVDETVQDSGWVPEPITTDPDVYIRAALAAASSFDTTKASREEWLTYLDT